MISLELLLFDCLITNYTLTSNVKYFQTSWNSGNSFQTLLWFFQVVDQLCSSCLTTDLSLKQFVHWCYIALLTFLWMYRSVCVCVFVCVCVSISVCLSRCVTVCIMWIFDTIKMSQSLANCATHISANRKLVFTEEIYQLHLFCTFPLSDSYRTRCVGPI